MKAFSDSLPVVCERKLTEIVRAVPERTVWTAVVGEGMTCYVVPTQLYIRDTNYFVFNKTERDRLTGQCQADSGSKLRFVDIGTTIESAIISLSVLRDELSDYKGRIVASDLFTGKAQTLSEARSIVLEEISALCFDASLYVDVLETPYAILSPRKLFTGGLFTVKPIVCGFASACYQLPDEFLESVLCDFVRLTSMCKFSPSCGLLPTPFRGSCGYRGLPLQPSFVNEIVENLTWSFFVDQTSFSDEFLDAVHDSDVYELGECERSLIPNYANETCFALLTYVSLDGLTYDPHSPGFALLVFQKSGRIVPDVFHPVLSTFRSWRLGHSLPPTHTTEKFADASDLSMIATACQIFRCPSYQFSIDGSIGDWMTDIPYDLPPMLDSLDSDPEDMMFSL